MVFYKISKVGEVRVLLEDALTNNPFLDFNGCSDKVTSIYDKPELMVIISSPDYAWIIKTLLSIVILVLGFRPCVWVYFMMTVDSPDKKQVLHNESTNLEDGTLEPKQDEERQKEIPLKKS